MLGLPAGAALAPDGKGGYDIVQDQGDGIPATVGHIVRPAGAPGRSNCAGSVVKAAR